MLVHRHRWNITFYSGTKVKKTGLSTVLTTQQILRGTAELDQNSAYGTHPGSYWNHVYRSDKVCSQLKKKKVPFNAIRQVVYACPDWKQKKVYYVLEQNLLYPGLQGQNLFSYKCRSKPAITVVLTSKKKKTGSTYYSLEWALKKDALISQSSKQYFMKLAVTTLKPTGLQ